MENVNCNICNLDNSRLLVTKNSFKVVKCAKCGLIYVNPRPSEEELKAYYTSHNPSTPGRQQLVREKRFGFMLDRLSEIREPGGKLLDVGCFKGTFIAMARARGWDVFGIDVNTQALQYARENGFEVSEATIMKNDFPDGSFDIITLLDSIEHMPDPIGAIKRVNSILKDDGLLILRTPNAGGLFPRTTFYLFAKLFGIWEHATPPKHLYQFSVETMRKTLTKAGFDVINVELDEIYSKSTIEELEEEMANYFKKLIGSFDKAAQTKTIEYSDTSAVKPNKKTQIRSHDNKPTHNKIFRTLLHLVSATLVYLIYPLARLFKRGDSMILIAKKAEFS